MSSRRRRSSRNDVRGKDRMHQSRLAPVSIGFVLLSGFVWIGFRGSEMVILALASTILSFVGWLLARITLKRMSRSQGLLQGEAAALIGFWGNLVFLLLSLPAFLLLLLLTLSR